MKASPKASRNECQGYHESPHHSKQSLTFCRSTAAALGHAELQTLVLLLPQQQLQAGAVQRGQHLLALWAAAAGAIVGAAAAAAGWAIVAVS
eukprot:1160046-Pelagomonas_calceolata.AAC.7